jgi:hypothetical protein
MDIIQRLRAVLDLHKDKFPHLLGRAKAIRNGIADHPELFITPEPSLLILENRIEAFDDAQQLVGTYKGAAAERALKARELIFTLESTRTYVQKLVDSSPEQGVILILAAAMKVGQPPSSSSPSFRLRRASPPAPCTSSSTSPC